MLTACGTGPTHPTAYPILAQIEDPTMTRINAYLLLGATWVATQAGCIGGGDEKEEENLPIDDALNAWLRAQYPDGHAPDRSAADVPDNEAAHGMNPPHMPLFSNQILTSEIEYQTEAPVTSFCMSFGAPEDGWCIPVDNEDVTQEGTETDGTLGLAVQMPPELCANLSQICHDIKCYEFAETSAGTFTAANVAFLAAACGNCDEPSCQELIGECSTEGYCLTDAECPEDQSCVQGTCVGTGDLHFSLTWSAPTDLDLYITTPSGATIYYGNPSADGGTLDVDNTSGGGGSVENVYFDEPLAGTYSVWVNLFSGDPASFSLSVDARGDILLTESGSLSSEGSDSTTWTIEY